VTATRRVALAALLLAAAAAAQDVLSGNRGTVRDVAASTDERIGALDLLTIAGALDPATACAALAADDEAVAAAAAALVRHRVLALDDAWFAALDADPRAARRLLDELAIAPRPSADAWLLRWAARPERTADERCLALAARSGAWTNDDRAVFFAGLLAAPAGDGVAAARRVLPGRVADGLVGRIHQEVAAGRLPFDEALRVFDRATPVGVRQLLGLALQLPGDQGASLLRHVHDQRPELVLERAQAELDDAERTVDPRWLPFVAPLLAEPKRVARVASLLAAGDVAVRDAAFDALLAARIASPAVLAFVAPEADADAARARLPRLLDRTIDTLPESSLRAWLARGDGVGETVARFLPRRRELSGEFAGELVAATLAAGTVDGRYFRPVALAVVGAGDESAVRRIWPLVRPSAELAPFAEALVRRRAPWGIEVLRGEGAPADGGDDDAQARRRQLACVARAELGDVTAVPALVARARSLSAEAARRCAQSPTPPSTDDAQALLDAVGVPRYGDTRSAAGAAAAANAAAPSIAAAIELLAWAARAADERSVAARLQAFWRDPQPPAAVADLQAEALPALARGPLAAALRQELRQLLAAGPLDDRGEALAFAVVESLAEPLDGDALALCADLVLEPARRDRFGEAARAERWSDGRGGYLLVGAVALRLRAAPPPAAAAAFARAAAAACADPAGPGATSARARAVLTALARAPEVRDAVGRALGPWLAAVPVAQAVWPRIVASWWASVDAVARGDVPGARQGLGLALRLLHEPIGRPDLRRDLLGERDPGAGVDPHAALACLPHRIAYLDAMQRGDARAAATAAAAWREFAGRDAATIADLPAPPTESPR
jgi:hypothetical protein